MKVKRLIVDRYDEDDVILVAPCDQRYRRRSRYSLYGMRDDVFQAFVDSQAGRCAICHADYSDDPSALCIDHDRLTRKVRGLLCTPCNQSLGGFGHSTERLSSAAAYLDRPPVLDFTIQHSTDRVHGR